MRCLSCSEGYMSGNILQDDILRFSNHVGKDNSIGQYLHVASYFQTGISTGAFKNTHTLV